MPSPWLQSANAKFGRGEYSEAVDDLWTAQAYASDANDLEELREIVAFAEVIRMRGGAAAGQEAARLLDSIRALVGEHGGDQVVSVRRVLPITSGNDLPGFEITEVIGPVFGLTVRARDVLSQLGAKLKGGTVGGELRAMTEALEQSRVQALRRMEDHALELGADGVIAFRLTVAEMAGTWVEISAYGTAVRAIRSSVGEA